MVRITARIKGSIDEGTSRESGLLNPLHTQLR
jgi:hypothetical protein